MQADDASLAIAAQSGDSDAFAALYERHVRRIYEFVYFKTHHRETAEDVTSQTFLKAWERLASFDAGRGPFIGWLHGIARNLVVDHYRALRPTEEIDDAWEIPDDAVDVERDADTALKVRKVRAFLATLTPEQREVVILRLWHGYSFGEIAGILGKTEGAAKMAYKRALGSLREGLVLALLFSFFTL